MSRRGRVEEADLGCRTGVAPVSGIRNYAIEVYLELQLEARCGEPSKIMETGGLPVLPRFKLVLAVRSVIQTAVSNPFQLGVLGSGKGSNFVAIAEAIAAGKIPAEVAVVLSDVEHAGILSHARDRKLPAQFIPPGKFRTKLDEESERAFVSVMQSAQVDLVVLAGFMRVLKGEFLRAFEGRIVNIHPSLLPSFPGLEAWKQALDHGVKVTGCTVHFVDAGVDSGPIIGQQTVPVLDTDTPETLHQRIHAAEHELYPKCVAAIARGQISVQGRKVIWKS
jgi:phosphoribosylglycinamide formyltransferase-1